MKHSNRPYRHNLPLLRLLLLAVMLVLLQACASVPPGERDPHDPFESYNRAMYAFNDAVDRSIARPVAEAYEKTVPQPVQSGVSNFFSNLNDVWVMFNNILQFKFDQAASDLSRLMWNTTVGVFGLFDVATPMGLTRHNEDFGQTLAVWGVSDGPYLVLPLLGPSTLRDTGALVVDYSYDPLSAISDDEAYWAAFALRVIDRRVQLLGATRIMEQAAIDPYVFMRDAYLQHRRNLIYDGDPPREIMDAPPPSDEDLELERLLELDSPGR